MPAGWAAAAAAAVGLVGSSMQADAAGDAAAAQGQAADRSMREQQRQAEQARQDQAPFRNTGVAANSRLSYLLGLGGAPQLDKSKFQTGTKRDLVAVTKDNLDAKGYLEANQDVAADRRYGSNPTGHFNDWGFGEGRQQYVDVPTYDEAAYQAAVAEAEKAAPTTASSALLRKFTADDLEADPVYKSGLKFGLDRGTDAINARATASGMYDSGATLKALTQFGNDYGSTKANESYNRFTNDQGNIFNKLSGVSGSGQVATNQINSTGMNAANNISQTMEGAGNARAAGIVGGANAWGGAVTGANNAYNNYQSNQRLDALLAEQKNKKNLTSPYSTSPYYTGYDASGDYAYG